LEKLLTADEVAEQLRLSRWTVYGWAREGILPSVRLGGRVLFDPGDIQAAIARAKQPAASPGGPGLADATRP
jgi:excisionase family DNA binding protein